MYILAIEKDNEYYSPSDLFLKNDNYVFKD